MRVEVTPFPPELFWAGVIITVSGIVILYSLNNNEA